MISSSLYKMKTDDIGKVINILKKEYKKFIEPIVTKYSIYKKPYWILIATILSLRTKDEVTRKAAEKLLDKAKMPSEMIKLSASQIEKLIYPVGFYKTKAKNIIQISKELIEKYGSIVPDEIDELLKFKGVGRKTANLVITLGYGKPGICVDTHVHRLSNRLGYVKTKTPEKTEFALRDKLPKKHWIVYNDLLVAYGQNLCVPISPFCNRCKIKKYCDRIGVAKSR